VSVPSAAEPSGEHPVPSIRSLLRDLLPAVALGGAIGSLARWGVAEALPHHPGQFPWATWLVNVSGSFALGVVMALSLALWPHHRYLRPFLGAGVLGGYTTFSTWMLDTRSGLEADAVVAILYVGATLAVGLPAAAAGLRLGRAVARGRR